MEVLGQERGKAALEEHFNTWITESDIETMFQYGINHLRIPVPFWAWIPTVGNEPYLNDTSVYQAQLERVLGYAYARGMYAIIDCHSMPGSQNGEESSGHVTTTPSWFGGSADTETPDQIRSDQMVVTITEWLATNPYRSVVTGIEVINEPRPYTPAQIDQLRNYYERSYATIQKSAWPVATFLHNGYTNLTVSLERWRESVLSWGRTLILWLDNSSGRASPPTMRRARRRWSWSTTRTRMSSRVSQLGDSAVDLDLVFLGATSRLRRTPAASSTRSAKLRTGTSTCVSCRLSTSEHN